MNFPYYCNTIYLIILLYFACEEVKKKTDLERSSYKLVMNEFNFPYVLII